MNNEDNFWDYNRKINNYIINEEYEKLDDALFEKYKEIFENTVNDKNYFLLGYNYYLNLSYNNKLGFEEKLEQLFRALSCYQRINIKEENLFKYKNKIDEAIQKACKDMYEDDIENLVIKMEVYIEFVHGKELLKDEIGKKKFVTSIDKFIYIMNNRINLIKNLDFKTVNICESIKEKCKSICEKLKRINNKNITFSNLCEIIYKISKKQMYYITDQTYFEKEKNKVILYNEVIEEYLSDMYKYSKYSLKAANRHFSEVSKNDRVEVMLSQKQIDVYLSEFYYLLYKENDTNGAWGKIIELKKFLVTEVFDNNTNISDATIENITNDWILLQVFNKISILKREIETLSNNASIEWIKELLNKIYIDFNEIESLFKYSSNNSSVSRLESVDTSFIGNFIEYMIYKLIIEMKSVDKSKLKYNLEDFKYKELINIINNTNINAIKLNYKEDIKSKKPDIDINIGNSTAILIKNGVIDWKEKKVIKNEIDIVVDELKYKKCYYIINFNKNINQISMLKSFFEGLAKEKNIEILVDDIKCFYDEMLNVFIDRHIYNFSVKQLYKLFGV